jgi:hypothetical protein
MSRPRASTPRIHTHTFQVRIRDGAYAPPDAESIWREIELRGDQTLADLGQEIPPAFGFDDDHLWSFFLSGKRWDESSEYASMQMDDIRGAGRQRTADRLRIRDAPAGREFLFLFDYGDEWLFGVKLVRSGEVEPAASYPRVVASHGEAPPQYPDADDWDDEDEDEEEEEAYQEERARLLERFEAWAAQHGASETTPMAAELLDYRWEGGGEELELTRWTADDLRDFLLEWCPRVVMATDEELQRAIPSVRAFMLFLDDAGLMDPESDRYGTLDATLDWIAPRFEKAMRDVSRFSPAKAAISAMQADGVDVDDARAVDEFLSEFELPAEFLLAQEAAGAPLFPPVTFPPPDELRAAAAAAPTLGRLREVTEWVGEGRARTEKGDLRDFDLMLDWARKLRLVRTYKGRLLRVKGQDLLDDPLELFSRAVDALPSLSAKLLPRRGLEVAFVDGLGGAVIDVLAGLYLAEEPMTVEELADHVWMEHVNVFAELEELDPLTKERRAALDDEVRQLLGHLQELGVAEVAGKAAGQSQVRLTPLGLWKTNRLMRALGADAPAIGDYAGEDFETLLDHMSSYDEAARRAELRAWCQAHGDGAASELAAYARGAAAFEHQTMVFMAFEEIGAAAEAEVRALLDHAEMRPLAKLWLVERGLEDPDSIDPETHDLMMAKTLLLLLEIEGPATLVERLGALGQPKEQATWLEALWRVATPGVSELLEAIGKAHPVPEVAKSARRAAFKRRSAGLG